MLEREKILLSDHINFIANGPKVSECEQVQVEGNLANTGYNEQSDWLTSTRHRSKDIQSINFKLYRHKAKDVIQLYEKFYSEILNSFRVIDDFAY